MSNNQTRLDGPQIGMINNYGYCDICATDVLHFVASIFARGDVKEEK